MEASSSKTTVSRDLARYTWLKFIALFRWVCDHSRICHTKKLSLYHSISAKVSWCKKYCQKCHSDHPDWTSKLIEEWSNRTTQSELLFKENKGKRQEITFQASPVVVRKKITRNIICLSPLQVAVLRRDVSLAAAGLLLLLVQQRFYSYTLNYCFPSLCSCVSAAAALLCFCYRLVVRKTNLLCC